MGDVVSVDPYPDGANWVKISYKNAWEAARAVRKNGEIFGRNCMIGVKWAVSLVHELLTRTQPNWTYEF